ncbi:MAG: hypothetical protein EOO71_36390, partial [Myxococcaceae bacterium]
MYRLCLLGCVLLLGACGEKAPEEGALRVTVKYGTYRPACVRVAVQDAQGHAEGTDIPSSKFKDPEARELRVAVLRRAEWDRELTVTVSSFDAVAADRCDGEAVETRGSDGTVSVLPKQFAFWEVQLKTEDADGDQHLVGAMWSKEPDCDDQESAIHPGASEACGSTVDLNCNKRIGCQETGCRSKPCDDGSACTTGDYCDGEGMTAKCLSGTEKQCPVPSGICDARQACEPTTGQCAPIESTEGRDCRNASDKCTASATCDATGKCVATQRDCTSTDQCLQSKGTCNTVSGLCDYTPRPNTASCSDGLNCTSPDRCNGSGACEGAIGNCEPPPCHRIKQACTASTECEYEVALNAACNTASGIPGVCLADATCSPFPYRPLNFDPNTIASADIGELKTNADVVFDTQTSTWNPESAVTTLGTLKVIPTPQGAGNPEALLIPVRTLELGGTLRTTGPRPVILAVFGEAMVSQSILATGIIENGNAACGSSQGGPGIFTDTTGGGGGGG